MSPPPSPSPLAAAHAALPEAVLAALESDAAAGLAEAEVARRQARDGTNALPEGRATPLAVEFLRQFKSPLIWLLLAAAVVALVLGERADAAVIAVVLVANAAVGTWQERRAARSMAALKKLSTARARVVRGGVEATVDAAALVPGDVLLLAGGDAVPADARLLQAAQLACAEGTLTGESVPVAKAVAPAPPGAVLAERTSMVFSGTLVTTGRGRAVVVATGPRTELGRIAGLTQAGEEPTPLEARLSQFGRFLAVLAVVLFLVVLGVGWLRGLPMAQVLMVGISQLVSVVPEGLPIALTIALAMGMRRMAQRRALVRHLGAVETLGCTTVICTDKTGTLTLNQMTVVRAWLPGGRTLEADQVGPALLEAPGGPVGALLDAATACNDASLVEGRALGDPTELALLELARRAGWSQPPRPRLAELPFDPSTRLMATAHPGLVLLKGAPEAVFGLCRLEGADLLSARAAAEAMAAGALRVLAFARAEGALEPAAGFEGLQGRGELLGLCGEVDPPREGVKEAVRACRRAGIRIIMLTGDHRATGLAIARDLELAAEGDLAVDLSTEDLEATLAERLDRVAVFARVQPEQKLRIVEALQRRGEVVAMTGDGVNDAPALVRSDVGVAMGLGGTDVAREASDLVLADDDFSTIVRAVEEGRIVYRNIKKATLLLLASSLAEMVILVAAMAAGLPMPFAAVQILWNNVVTEGTITLNFVMEPGEGDELARPPIPRHEPIVTRALFARLAFLGLAMSGAVLGFYAWRRSLGLPPVQVQTELFTLLAVCEWFNVLNCRSRRRSAFSMPLIANRWLLGGLLVSILLQAAVVYVPPLTRVFHTEPLSLGQLGLIAAVGSLVLWVEELRKLIRRRTP